MAIDILPKNLKREVKSIVLQAVGDILSDPDLGLELSKKAKNRLSQSLKSRGAVPFSEIKRKHY